jgi:hypothetical protein
MDRYGNKTAPSDHDDQAGPRRAHARPRTSAAHQSGCVMPRMVYLPQLKWWRLGNLPPRHGPH